MPEYYYSTQPFLAWCLNHYFYNQIHYVWVGTPFYPYRASNPVSSSPYKIYALLYEPFKELDRYNKFVIQFRNDLKSGVRQQIQNDDVLKNDLFEICDKIELQFFYPIVYRVDIELIADERKVVANSGAEASSNEYLIRDLREEEFDILFKDFFFEESLDNNFAMLMAGSTNKNDALAILKARSS